MAYIQKNSPFKIDPLASSHEESNAKRYPERYAKQSAVPTAMPATKKKGKSSYDSFIDNTASYLKGEQGLIPDSLTGGKPTRQAIGDGIRNVANSIDPSKKLKKSTKKALSVSKNPNTKTKPSKPTGRKQGSKPSKPSKPSKSTLQPTKNKTRSTGKMPKPDPSKYNLQYPRPANQAELEAKWKREANKK